VIWAYDGWIAVSMIAGEVRAPERLMRRIIIAGMLAIVFLYVGANVGYFTEFRPLNSDDVPVLLLNSTSVQLGRRIVASPYPWPLSDVSVEEQDPIDFHKLTGRDVSVATAVHNTARFPYISAAGRLRSDSRMRVWTPIGHSTDTPMR